MIIIIGGDPAGMASAIYGAHDGLSLLVIAPSMPWLLQGKGLVKEIVGKEVSPVVEDESQ